MPQPSVLPTPRRGGPLTIGVASVGVLAGLGLSAVPAGQAGAVTIRDQQTHAVQDAALITDSGAPLEAVSGNLVQVGVASGVYLGDGWVLTAAHFNPNTGGRTDVTFDSGFSTGGDVFRNPDWTGDFVDGNDFALIRLDSAPADLPDVQLFGGGSEELAGQTVTFFGYGLNGKGSSGTNQPGSTTGNLHAGQNRIDQLGGTVFNNNDAFVDQVAFFDFDRPNSAIDNPLGSRFALEFESMLASGDSGGGVFVTDEDGTARLAGVNSLLFSPSNRPPAGYGSVGAATTVDGILAWIADVTNDVVVQTGDANLNGTVEQGDLNAVLNNWGAVGGSWSTGDLNADGIVDQADLNAVLNNWGESNAPSLNGVLTVPEPGLAGLGVVVALAMMHRRR
ncbi:MAG: trypsin-like serine protease [Planctomycetota bacterium]